MQQAKGGINRTNIGNLLIETSVLTQVLVSGRMSERAPLEFIVTVGLGTTGRLRFRRLMIPFCQGLGQVGISGKSHSDTSEYS